MGRVGSEPVLPIKWPVTINIMINLHGNSVGMYKQTYLFAMAELLLREYSVLKGDGDIVT